MNINTFFKIKSVSCDIILVRKYIFYYLKKYNWDQRPREKSLLDFSNHYIPFQFLIESKYELDCLSINH